MQKLGNSGGAPRAVREGHCTSVREMLHLTTLREGEVFLQCDSPTSPLAGDAQGSSWQGTEGSPSLNRINSQLRYFLWETLVFQSQLPDAEHELIHAKLCVLQRGLIAEAKPYHLGI